MARNKFLEKRSLVLALIFASLSLFPNCQSQESTHEEKYISVKLNDSLSRFDSVEVWVLVAGDTSKIIGKIWNGPLSKPVSISDYRLPEGENRQLAIRVRGYDTNGILVQNTLITKVAGQQIVTSLPLPPPPPIIIPVPIPVAKPSVQLAFLIISPGSFSPVFDSTHHDYMVYANYSDSVLTITAVSAYSSANLELSGAGVKLEGPSNSVNLAIGENIFTIKVLAGSETAYYTLKAVRAAKVTPVDTTIITPVVTDSVYKNWKYSSIISVNLGMQGLDTGVLVKKFPMLIRLTSRNFDFTKAHRSGNDIRFANPAGAELNYEISRWDYGGRKADLWVNMDSLVPGISNYSLRMFWGNDTATLVTNGSKVFTPDVGYLGVWHLEEYGLGKAGEFQDATGQYPGTGGEADGSSLPGRSGSVVGYGQDFHNGSTDGAISIPKGFDPGSGNWTFQAWINPVTSCRGAFFSKGDSYAQNDQRFRIGCFDDDLSQLVIQRDGLNYFTKIMIPKSTFTHVAVTLENQVAKVYLDGTLRGSGPFSAGSNGTGRAVFGSTSASGNDKNFDGYMDELWFSNLARPQRWIQLLFENQKANSSMVTVGPASMR
jgi:hypothetical protein